MGGQRRGRRPRASSTCARRRRGTRGRSSRRSSPASAAARLRSALKIDVEFVSANPTGPLPVSAGRNAAYGDSLARLLAFAGHDVVREYYFNDAGAQMEHFGRSLLARARGEQPHEEGYQGEYLIAIAEKTGLGPDAPAREFARAGAEAMFALIRETLTRFRVTMDVWTNEAAFHDAGHVEAAIERARSRGHLVERDGATWLVTEPFGDDKDRVVLRSDGTPDVLRIRSRLPHRQARSRVRQGAVRARRRSPRVRRPSAGRPPRPSASIPIASRCRSTRWCTSPRAARRSACRSVAATSCCSTS